MNPRTTPPGGPTAIAAAAWAAWDLARAGADLLGRCTHLLASCCATTLTALGGAHLLLLWEWDQLLPPDTPLSSVLPDVTLTARLAALMALHLWLFVKLLSPAASRGRAWSRRMAARHEAGHALVAAVLGMHVSAATVPPRPDRFGVGGYVRYAPPEQPDDLQQLWRLVVRQMAASLAGVAAERAWQADPLSKAAARIRLQTQGDWYQAREAARTANAISPRGEDLLFEVFDMLLISLSADPWRRAIAKAAGRLVQARRREVPGEAFAEIALRYDLRLPGVEALIATPTGLAADVPAPAQPRPDHSVPEGKP